MTDYSLLNVQNMGLSLAVMAGHVLPLNLRRTSSLEELKEILSRLRLFQNGSLWTISVDLAASLGGIISDMERALKELSEVKS